MIRFSAALVVVAVGVLVGGMATSSLLLVYVAIGLSVVALLTLAFGVALKREEIFGEQQGQSALAGQGANASFGQERPGPAVSAERSAAHGRQDVSGESFGQSAVTLGQAAWAAAPDTHAGAGQPGRPRPETPPWRERFASSVPQQPAAQTRVDTALTRADVAQTQADLTKTQADLAKTRTDLTGTKAATAAGRPAAVNWFERLAPAQPAGESPRDDTSGEPPASSAGDEPVADVDVEDHDGGIETEDADVADASVADAHAKDTDDVEDTTEPGAADPEAEAETEASASADAADSSPDGDQEGRSGQREVTVVPGVPRYHDASCILIRFMGDDDLEKMTMDEATEAGCTPCRACMPEYA